MFIANYILGILSGTWFFIWKNTGRSCYGHPSDYSYFCEKVEKRSIECICYFALVVIYSVENSGTPLSYALFIMVGLLASYPYYLFTTYLYQIHNRHIIFGIEIFECLFFDGYFIYKIITI